MGPTLLRSCGDKGPAKGKGNTEGTRDGGQRGQRGGIVKGKRREGAGKRGREGTGKGRPCSTPHANRPIVKESPSTLANLAIP